MTEDEPSYSDELSLTAIDAQRSPEEKARDGKSGDTMYRITYEKKEAQNTTHRGKVTELGRIDIVSVVNSENVGLRLIV